MRLPMMNTEEDKRKFVVLYEKYRYLMMKVAYNILCDYFLAEDAVHNAFIKVAQNIDKVQNVDTQETKRLLIVITKNASIDIYRKRSSQMKKEIFVDELSDNEMPLTYIEADVDNQILDILKGMPIKYRDVFLLKYSSRLENKEIAKLLRISEGTVRQRIVRGKAMVQEALDNLEDSVSGASEGNG